MTWQKYDGQLPQGFEQIPEGGTGQDDRGTWFTNVGHGQAMVWVGHGAYQAEGGNVVVDAQTADRLCAGSFKTPTSWPPIMTQEAVKWGSQSSSGDIFIWCADDSMLYQVTATGNGGAVLARCDSGTIPQPGAPAPSGGGTTAPGSTANVGTMPTAMKVGLGIAAAAALGVGAWAILGRKKHHGSHHASESHRRGKRKGKR